MGRPSAPIMAVFLLTGALPSTAFSNTKIYHFVNSTLNWTDAQSACREDFIDLATTENTADMETLLSLLSIHGGVSAEKAWIGLYEDLEDSWRWSLSDSSFYGEGERRFRNWYSAQPNNLDGQQYCVELFSVSPFFGTWGDLGCSEERFCVCYNGTINGSVAFIKSNTLLNWTDAQMFCRQNYVDLASIRNQAENDIIANVAEGNFVWIGLHREPVWSDGSNSQFTNWADRQPDSPEHQCVAAAIRDSGRWSDESCSQRLPFICYTTGPPSPSGFRAVGQTETSITLQWNEVNSNVSFILQFNETETHVEAVTYLVSSLTAASVYSFTLYSVFEESRSTGVPLRALTAPSKPSGFRTAGVNKTSITLHWNRMKSGVGFILQFNDGKTRIAAGADGDGPVTHTVSSLSAGTKYSFTLSSVFGTIRSAGVTLSAFTYPLYILALDIKVESFKELTHSDVENAIDTVLSRYGVSPDDLSVKIRKIQSV